MERAELNERTLTQHASEVLKQKYVQRADERQKEMGLSYTLAETHDLAKTMVSFSVWVIREMIFDAINEGTDNPFKPGTRAYETYDFAQKALEKPQA